MIWMCAHKLLHGHAMEIWRCVLWPQHLNGIFWLFLFSHTRIPNKPIKAVHDCANYVICCVRMRKVLDITWSCVVWKLYSNIFIHEKILDFLALVFLLTRVADSTLTVCHQSLPTHPTPSPLPLHPYLSPPLTLVQLILLEMINRQDHHKNKDKQTMSVSEFYLLLFVRAPLKTVTTSWTPFN